MLDAHGRIDILVNITAGRGRSARPASRQAQPSFRAIVDLNMRGCFNTIHAVAPAMMARRSMEDAKVDTTFELIGRALRLAYSASKWGLRGLTKSFGAQNRAPTKRRRRACVAPGMVDGPPIRDGVFREMAQRLGRTLGSRGGRSAMPPTSCAEADDDGCRRGDCLPLPALFPLVAGVDLPLK